MKAVVAGMFLPPQGVNPLSPSFIPGAEPAPREKINRIWADVVKEYPYQALSFQPGGGAIFAGQSVEQLVLIQPPLVQIRDLIDLEVRPLAERVQSVFRAIQHHLGGLPQNLGVKLVANAPAPGNDAVAFIRSELLRGDEDALALAGNLNLDAGIKLTMTGTDYSYTLLVEPLRSDTRSLFIDLDGQFPGVANVEHVRERVLQVDSFMHHQVQTYLESRAKEWGQ
jgi:hypothetical protein